MGDRSMMGVIAMLGMAGMFGSHRGPSIVTVEDEEPHDAFTRLTSPRPAPARRYPWTREPVEHFETPKPLTKRQRRRARGRG